MMPRQQRTQPDSPLPAFRYSPGDGYTYLWNGGTYATVMRHVTGAKPGQMAMIAVDGEAVYMGGCARTATAFAARINEYRVSEYVRTQRLLAP